jgi:hypothetical protein
MKVHIYQILHVVSMILLVAFVFQAFANPDPKKRKRTMMLTGIFALTMLIGGFGLITVMKIGFPLWILIKLVCWFGLASIGGMAYRMPTKIPMLTAVTIILIVVAVASVYFRFGQGSLE